jgi:hypothetical protein
MTVLHGRRGRSDDEEEIDDRDDRDHNLRISGVIKVIPRWQALKVVESVIT